LTENLIIISAIGLVVGFILSIPAAGPTTIVILTNALKGRIRYCNMVNIGASFADLVYVFISVYGLTKLYSLYKPYIPLILIGGSLFILFISWKIAATKLKLETEEASTIAEKVVAKEQKGFLTGIMLGFFNPNLFISWMASSFVVLTVLASFGFNTGGLDKKVSDQLTEINLTGYEQRDTNSFSLSHFLKPTSSEYTTFFDYDKPLPKNYPFLLSLFYAISISIGSIIWFYYMTIFIAKFRKRINQKMIQRMIQSLGIVLFIFGLYLGYKGIMMS
jgi:threonine/homoserine/homoserine lactone efflux protein